MTKRKRGRPRNLPVESSHWISYVAALEEAIERFGDAQLAIQKLGAALASGTIRCKTERLRAKPKLMKGGDQVAVRYLPAKLREGWEDRHTIDLNGEPQSGWLFLWNYDLIKYFNISAEEGPASAVKTQKTPAAVGHPVVRDWREIMLFAVRACLDFPALKANAIVLELRERLEAAGIKVPVLTFDERHQLTPK